MVEHGISPWQASKFCCLINMLGHRHLVFWTWLQSSLGTWWHRGWDGEVAGAFLMVIFITKVNILDQYVGHTLSYLKILFSQWILEVNPTLHGGGGALSGFVSGAFQSYLSNPNCWHNSYMIFRISFMTKNFNFFQIFSRDSDLTTSVVRLCVCLSVRLIP